MKTPLSLITGLVLLSGQAWAEDANHGAQLAAACASCHAPAGGGQGIPAIVGLDREKIIAAMHAYKKSESPSHVMHAVALSLSDEELLRVASYLAEHDKSGKQQ